MNDPIVAMVIAQFRERSKRGIKKYNTTLAENDLSLVQWLEHAKEEAMDQVLYLERAIHEIRSKENSIQQTFDAITSYTSLHDPD
jgi:succinate dehydrogenase flavin-adding protein (antitoxin of CptAB toxin-antitoxin module)